jgi:cysteine desulfurase/selenocysteine lyase
VYLDNGATTQKPQAVMDVMTQFYTSQYATIHRGVYETSQIATQKVDQARKTVQKFLNAKHDHEIIFTKGTTEAINLVARSLGSLIPAGKTILVTQMDHHANFVPWQQIAKEKELVFKVVPLTPTGELDEDAFEKLLTPEVAILAMPHVSNSLGTINPIQKWIEKAHQVGAKVLIDGAQGAAHTSVDVQALNCDFYCFSGHKCYGPTGIGVLYGKEMLLNEMPPYQFGGDMVYTVTAEETTFAPLPEKFEAGTPPIVEILGLEAALQFLSHIGFEVIEAREAELLALATQKLSQVPGLKIIGTAPHKAAVVSFVLADVHPHDIGSILDDYGVAIRAGHHCAQPVMQYFQVPATARASFSFYNTHEEIDVLKEALCEAVRRFS